MQPENEALFTISELEHHDGVVNATLAVNKDCEIFKGHFPEHPVVPGACMLQIVKEVLEEALDISLLLKKANHLKFICMIDPGDTQAVDLDIVYKAVEEDIEVTAKLSNGEVVCFKFQGRFVKI